MTPREAKQILLIHRPGVDPADDPVVAEALRLAQSNPDLQRWLEQHRAFQRGVRDALRHQPVPAGAVEEILRQRTVIPLPDRRRVPWLALAAAVVILVSLAVFWMNREPQNTLATFRSRMVSAVLRQYTMDLETNDMAAIRRHLAAHQAPSNYVLPPGLSQVAPTGVGVLSWQGQRVAMVCLDGGTHGTLFLFVVSRQSVPDDLPTRQFAPVSKLSTFSWEQDGLVYVLAGSGDEDWLRQYLSRKTGDAGRIRTACAVL